MPTIGLAGSEGTGGVKAPPAYTRYVTKHFAKMEVRPAQGCVGWVDGWMDGWVGEWDGWMDAAGRQAGYN